MKRTASIGSRVPPAVTMTRRPSQGPRSPTALGDGASVARRPRRSLVAGIARRRRGSPRPAPAGAPGSGSRPRPCSPREASRPSSGSITSTPRSRRVARLAWVAASAYMRSFIAGAISRGAVQARKDVVSIESAKPPASLATVLAEAGATRKASQLAASSRWPIGSWPRLPRLAGEGAAHRVALELGGEHGRADDPLEGGGADEAFGVLASSGPGRRGRPASRGARTRATCTPLSLRSHPATTGPYKSSLRAGRYAPSCGTRI